MITAEWKPIAELAQMVKDHDRLLLVGCATCVAECAAGGEREVQTLAPLLSMAVKKAGGNLEVITRTLEKQCEWEFVEELSPDVEKADGIMSLACGIGIQALAERFADVAVHPGVNTTSLCIREEPGLWTSRCAACGDCVLDETFGLCPISRCAKSLLNGPCGGTRESGKCEVDEDTDCIWHMIWERARDRDDLDRLIKVRRTKDWSGGRHGGPRRMLREDLRP
jgi:ferredoxin